jgi:hypothetical protein
MIQTIRKTEISLARPASRRLIHWLLVACFLTGLAVATIVNATVTTLATNQGNPGNIIVDGSRVYWINFINASVSSVDKLSGGGSSVLVHSPPANADHVYFADLVQDTSFLYFMRGESCGDSVYKVPKTSSSVVKLVDQQADGGSLGLWTGTLYFYSSVQWQGVPCNSNFTHDHIIETIPTQGGTPAPLTANLNISPGYFSTEGVYLHWSNPFRNINTISHIPLVGGGLSTDVAGLNTPWALTTPTTGPAGGYIFWTEGADPASLKRIKPGGVTLTLLTGISFANFRCFVQVDSFVYCAMANGSVVKVPIDGGTPVTAVSTTDAKYPLGLASDGTYLFWTTSGDGSIRRIAIPPTTSAATNVAAFSATLNGSVNPGGLTTSVYFQYGTTTGYGLTTAMQSQTGNTFRNVSANISSLMANHVYHFRVVATNSGGTTYGSDRTFTTLSATGPPVITTNPATFIASFSGTLNGSLDPHGLTTNVYFQYGTTTGYGLTTPPQSQSGNTYRNINANISGLLASHVYHFRIVATNSAGTRYGTDRTFTTLTATGAPVVTTNSAINVTSSSATLNGSLDPHGLTTSVYFQYGTTTSYGHTTTTQSQTGNTYRNITANISSLTTHSTYHFRIVAANSGGTRFGSDRIFTTP